MILVNPHLNAKCASNSLALFFNKKLKKNNWKGPRRRARTKLHELANCFINLFTFWKIVFNFFKTIYKCSRLDISVYNRSPAISKMKYLKIDIHWFPLTQMINFSLEQETKVFICYTSEGRRFYQRWP